MLRKGSSFVRTLFHRRTDNEKNEWRWVSVLGIDDFCPMCPRVPVDLSYVVWKPDATSVVVNYVKGGDFIDFPA